MAVLFPYLYRDEDNYKERGDVVFAGELSEGDYARLMAAAEGGEHFVAGQVGLPALQPSPGKKWDHGYHELDENEPEETDDEPTDPRAWDEFLADFEAMADKWDPVAECKRLGIPL